MITLFLIIFQFINSNITIIVITSQIKIHSYEILKIQSNYLDNFHQIISNNNKKQKQKIFFFFKQFFICFFLKKNNHMDIDLLQNH